MLITVRAPLRVSFFGGGTDYPEYFVREPGAVIGMAINKYIYVTALKLTEVINYRYRVAYSKNEMVKSVAEIEHPVIREALKLYGINFPLDISVLSDLPARSGLGSSSSFTVATLSLLDFLRGIKRTRYDIAMNSTKFEREILKENVGFQDQFHAAFGGINKFDFSVSGVKVSPIQMKSDCMQAFSSSLFLVYTGITRFASEIVESQIKNTSNHLLDKELNLLNGLVNECLSILQGNDSNSIVNEFGKIMHEGWTIKKSLSKQISSALIDELYEKGMYSGAIGGKLCGAGGGGFILFVVPNGNQANFILKMSSHSISKIDLDITGVTILPNLETSDIIDETDLLDPFNPGK